MFSLIHCTLNTSHIGTSHIGTSAHRTPQHIAHRHIASQNADGSLAHHGMPDRTVSTRIARDMGVSKEDARTMLDQGIVSASLPPSPPLPSPSYNG